MAGRRARRSVAVLLFLLAGCGRGSDADLEPLSIGGDFTLTGTDGKPFQLASLRGQTVLLFFGYTACPDVCPTTLARLARVYERLRRDGLDHKVTAVFVSVDPQRDTPAKLGEYLSYFAVPARGVTGSPAQLAPIVRRYGASYERVQVASAAGYLINHTTYVYLIDPIGRVRHLIRHEDPPDRIADLVERVIAEDCCFTTVPPFTPSDTVGNG